MGLFMNTRAALFILAAVTLLPGEVASRAAAASDQSLPQQQIDFELNDYGGRQYRLADFADKPVVVLAFLGTECPLVHRYSVRLEQIAKDYQGRGVLVLGVNSNRQDSITEIAAFARRKGISFPILKDTGNELADLVGAQRTPEVVVLNQSRQMVYRGGIDDQYGVGFTRDSVQNSWLTDAIEQTLSGERPKVAIAEAEGCLIGRLREPRTDADVTYGSHIAGIMNQHCVACHREGEIGPFNLTNYDDVAGWADMIREVVRDQRMPPWHADPSVGEFANARGLSRDEKSLIDKWVLSGAPAGDLTQVPEIPPRPDADWHEGKQPDQIISMGRRFTIPADGVVDYQYIKVDPGFTEDRWVKAAEIIPGSRDVVHHVLVFARAPRERRDDPGAGGGSFLAAYVPGLTPMRLPEGMAKLVPAGSELVFQLHYTPNGVQQEDESRIGLYFADESEVQQVVITQEAMQRDFTIPPGDAAYRVTSRSPRAPVPVQLLGMMPHMHVRGKSFEYFVVSKDGAQEPLLKVPAYDFNWQTSYRLAQPREIPVGSYVSCVAHFDNSANNLNNPDPSKPVGWGDQTTDEMMIGYFDVAVPRQVAAAGGGRSTAVERLLQRFDANGDGVIQKDEVSQRLQPLFNRLDSDNNGQLDEKELAAMNGRQ
jgi:peroxiredoxin/mono/diheme cytochrome c family protein